jgi:hypothetical protein
MPFLYKEYQNKIDPNLSLIDKFFFLRGKEEPLKPEERIRFCVDCDQEVLYKIKVKYPRCKFCKKKRYKEDKFLKSERQKRWRQKQKMKKLGRLGGINKNKI